MEKKEKENKPNISLTSFRRLINSMPEACFLSDRGGHIIAVNKSACRLTGYEREEMLDLKVTDLHEEPNRQPVEKYHERSFNGEDILFEIKLTRKNGEEVYTEISNSPMVIEGKTYVHAIVRDVSERHRLEEDIKEERDRLKELHSRAYDIFECENKNDASETTAEAGKEVLELETCGVLLRNSEDLFLAAFSTKLSDQKDPQSKIDRRLAGKSLKEGEVIWGNAEDLPEIVSEGENHKSVISIPVGKLGAFQAVSTTGDRYSEQDVNLAKLLVEHLRETLERIDLEEELREQSIRDPLTNLYNRRYFNETLKKEIERSKRDGYKNGFLMIDVNRFKEINDRYSHQTGDKVLKEVAHLLKENVRSTDTVVRYGGDEFLIMLVEADHGVAPTANRIREAVTEWNEENSLLDFPLTLAIGITLWSPSQDRDIETALKEADEKMYEDKRN
ncbi:diguanylate cyclase [Candidatus Bipolaricaulota bacterium]|nr:diguanylate cyclase [Candidatus Bipolaricaulota bacterium]